MEQGLILGRYRPLAELGEGGHGAVTLAFDTKMSRRVAIKRIPLSRTGVKRLAATSGLAEARTAALLNHPNVVTVYEWDTDEDEAFLIMEHVDGVSLAELLDQYSPLDVNEAAAVMAPVCEALSFAHDNGVLHLDLKPENVLITRDGSVKVADFGVASLTNAAGQAISAGGTLGYMPPEQLRGDPVDARSDVWALGTLAYEILTGSVPFSAGTVGDAVYKAENLKPPMPSEFVDGLPRAIDEVLAVALSPAMSGRQSNATDLAAELIALLGDQEAGRAGLKELVADLVEERGGEPSIARLGLWDRILHREPAFRRVAAAVVSAWAGWAGITQLGLGWPAAAGAAAVSGAVAVFAPPYGLAAGVLAITVGAFFTGPLHGLLVLASGVAWWLLLGRDGDWASMIPFCAPLFGVLGLSPALPLLGGLAVRDPRKTFAAGGLAGVALVLASVVSGAGPVSMQVSPKVLGDPLGQAATHALTLTATDWVAAVALVASWGAAMAICGLFARRSTRPAALTGAIAGMALMFAGTGPWVTGGQQVGRGVPVQFALSSILVAVVIALGPPIADMTDE